MIRDLAKGDSVVAKLGYEHDIAEGVLMACRERIKDIRTGIDTYRSLLAWQKAELMRTE